MGLHATPSIGIRFTYLSGPRGPENTGKSLPMHGGCTQPHALAYLPPTFQGNVAGQTSKGKLCQCMGAARNSMHWHTLFPLLFWAMWPRQVGEKYANAPGCMQPHALAYFSPWPRKVGEKVCQCMGLRAAPHIGILFPLLFWATWPRKSRGTFCQ